LVEYELLPTHAASKLFLQIALVGNPNFAIIDEAYPYIARRLMTDKSPRLRAALRYMVYGKDDRFDAENLIDMLQALEKFTSIRDDGDGTAYKVDGVRGNKLVGSAGDFSGSQKVDISDRETDIDGGRFRVSGVKAGALDIPLPAAIIPANDERTVRDALRFFFSEDGGVLRDFMLEEIVVVVDASGRSAAQTLVKSLGLDNLPAPAFLRALNPAISEQDKRMVEQIRKLIQFFFGNMEGATDSSRLRKLIPIFREYAPQLRDFGTLLVARLTEKNLSRGMKWLVDNRTGVRTFATNRRRAAQEEAMVR
jgi:aarF domain-containing kinase